MAMKVLAPFDSADEARKLIKAGADELYCGINTAWWQEKKIFSNARRMTYGNLSSFKELAKAVSQAQQHKVPVFLCANKYLPEQACQKMVEDIKTAFEIGIKGVIIADISLLRQLRPPQGCKLILSCLTPCLSKKAIDFYKQNRIDRIILPLNHFSVRELKEISLYAESINMETEVFINNVTCRNMPGNCLYKDLEIFKQADNKGIKGMVQRARKISRFVPPALKNEISRFVFSSQLHHAPCREAAELNIYAQSQGTARLIKTESNYTQDEDFAARYCNLCGIFQSDCLGITSGKIAGRGFPLARKLSDLRFARQFLDALKQKKIGKADFADFGRELFKRTYKKECNYANCGYFKYR